MPVSPFGPLCHGLVKRSLPSTFHSTLQRWPPPIQMTGQVSCLGSGLLTGDSRAIRQNEGEIACA
jgi:hypothetical protein